MKDSPEFNSLSIGFLLLSKNTLKSLRKNLEFLYSFKQSTNFKIQVLVVDSESEDGTKKYLESLSNDLINFIYIDNLNSKGLNRIEKIAYCRNKGFQHLANKFKKDFIFIPIDSDIEVFKFYSMKKFLNLIRFFYKENIEAMFPFSIPYYYDIFALHSENWSQFNFQKAELLKKNKKYLSFFINKKFIFNNQLKPSQLKEELITVKSAFGGMGMYKINKDPSTLTYQSEVLKSGLYCEHYLFNKNFKKIFINKNWHVPAPNEHINYKTMSLFEKFIYFIKTIYFDIKNE